MKTRKVPFKTSPFTIKGERHLNKLYVDDDGKQKVFWGTTWTSISTMYLLFAQVLHSR